MRFWAVCFKGGRNSLVWSNSPVHTTSSHRLRMHFILCSMAAISTTNLSHSKSLISHQIALFILLPFFSSFPKELYSCGMGPESIISGIVCDSLGATTLQFSNRWITNNYFTRSSTTQNTWYVCNFLAIYGMAIIRAADCFRWSP